MYYFETILVPDLKSLRWPQAIFLHLSIPYFTSGNRNYAAYYRYYHLSQLYAEHNLERLCDGSNCCTLLAQRDEIVKENLRVVRVAIV